MASYLFVYGTLRKALVTTHTTKEIAAIMQALPLVGTGKVQGQLYDLGQFPAAILGEDFSTQICGEIYALPHPREVLELLDVYEGFIPGELEASLFARIKTEITRENGTKLDCWIYVYNDWIARAHLIETGDYVKYVQARKQPIT